MKGNTLLLLLLILSFLSTAQTKLQPTKKLYLGVSNWIYNKKFAATDSITVSIGKTKKADTLYRLLLPVDAAGKQCIINGWNNGKISVKKSYKVEHMPLPTAVIVPSNWSTTQSAEDFSKSIGVVAILGNFNYLVSLETLSYTVTYKPKTGKKQVIKNKGTLFGAYGQSVKPLIQKATLGDKYIFTEIRVKQRAGDGAEIDPAIFKLRKMVITIK